MTLARLAACLLATWVISRAATAQEALALSIEEALSLAQARSERITAAEAAILRSRGEVLQARSGWFPQIQASASYTRTFASEFDDLDFGPTELPDGEIPEDGPAVDEAEGGLPFGRDNTWQVGVSVTQNLFTGGRIDAQTDLARAGQTDARLAARSTRASTALQTAEAYYDAVLGDALVAIAVASLEQARRTLAQAQVGFDIGAQPEFDVLRARVDVDHQEVERVRAVRQRDLSDLRLRQILDLPPALDLVLTTPLTEDPSREAAVIAGIPELVDPDRRVPVLRADAQVSARDAAVRVARSQYLPTVQLFANGGLISWPRSILPSLDPDDWKDTLSAGVQLQMPLFTGFRIRGEVLAARADLLQSQAQRQETAKLADLDTASALAELAAAEAAAAATAETVSLARRALTIAEVRYAEGISPQIELSDTRLQLQQAEVQRATALRDLQVARIRVALLPALPLDSAPLTAPVPATLTTPRFEAATRPLPTAPRLPGTFVAPGPP